MDEQYGKGKWRGDEQRMKEHSVLQKNGNRGYK